MTKDDDWKIFPGMPGKVTSGHIMVRDGSQQPEKFIRFQTGVSHVKAPLGGQKADAIDDRPITGTGDDDDAPCYVGLACPEDTLAQMDEMGIELGYDVARILWLGNQLERTVGQRLPREAIINLRPLTQGQMADARSGLAKLKIKLGEAPDQRLP